MIVSISKICIFLALINLFGYGQTQKVFKSSKRNYYYIEPEKKFNWFHANAECTRRNSTLLTIDSPEKDQEISQLLKDVYNGQTQPPFYIGGQDLGSFGRFVWIENGKPFKFINWEPNALEDKSKTDSHCVFIGTKGSAKWNIANCKRPYGFICEKKRDLRDYLRERQF